MPRRQWRDRWRRFRSLLGATLGAGVRWPVYLLVGLVPKDPTLWAFGSWTGHHFADNSKWLFLHLTRPGGQTSQRFRCL